MIADDSSKVKATTPIIFSGFCSASDNRVSRPTRLLRLEVPIIRASCERNRSGFCSASDNRVSRPTRTLVTRGRE